MLGILFRLSPLLLNCLGALEAEKAMPRSGSGAVKVRSSLCPQQDKQMEGKKPRPSAEFPRSSLRCFV